MTFKQHSDNIHTKANPCLNMLRTLTHTSYEHSKEDITTQYKQVIRPILTYANILWSSDIANTHTYKLLTIQNKRPHVEFYRLYTNNSNYIPHGGQGPSSQGPPRCEKKPVLFLFSRYLSPLTLHADKETQTDTHTPVTIYMDIYDYLPPGYSSHT